MARVKVNLTLEAEVVASARDLGVEMSRVAEAAISHASKLERNRRWREENREALDAYADEVAREGLPLSQFRTF